MLEGAKELTDGINNILQSDEGNNSELPYEETNESITNDGTPPIEDPEEDPEEDFNKYNKKGKKGKSFRGGSKKQRDKWYGYEKIKSLNVGFIEMEKMSIMVDLI